MEENANWRREIWGDEKYAQYIWRYGEWSTCWIAKTTVRFIRRERCGLIESRIPYTRATHFLPLIPSERHPRAISFLECLKFMWFRRCDIRAATRRVKWFVRRPRSPVPRREGIKTYFRCPGPGKVF